MILSQCVAPASTQHLVIFPYRQSPSPSSLAVLSCPPVLLPRSPCHELSFTPHHHTSGTFSPAPAFSVYTLGSCHRHLSKFRSNYVAHLIKLKLQTLGINTQVFTYFRNSTIFCPQTMPPHCFLLQISPSRIPKGLVVPQTQPAALCLSAFHMLIPSPEMSCPFFSLCQQTYSCFHLC